MRASATAIPIQKPGKANKNNDDFGKTAETISEPTRTMNITENIFCDFLFSLFDFLTDMNRPIAVHTQ